MKQTDTSGCTFELAKLASENRIGKSLFACSFLLKDLILYTHYLRFKANEDSNTALFSLLSCRILIESMLAGCFAENADLLPAWA